MKLELLLELLTNKIGIMKKIVWIILAVVCLVSCEKLDYDYGCCKKRPYGKNYYQETGYDYLSAEMLIGEWRCSYNMRVGNVDFKKIRFINSRKADITMCAAGDTDYFTETFTYSYTGYTLTFTKNGQTIQFKVDGYLHPELYIRDSFGRYTLSF